SGGLSPPRFGIFSVVAFSSRCKAILANRGEIPPLCGVPAVVGNNSALGTLMLNNCVGFHFSSHPQYIVVFPPSGLVPWFMGSGARSCNLVLYFSTSNFTFTPFVKFPSSNVDCLQEFA